MRAQVALPALRPPLRSLLPETPASTSLWALWRCARQAIGAHCRHKFREKGTQRRPLADAIPGAAPTQAGANPGSPPTKALCLPLPRGSVGGMEAAAEPHGWVHASPARQGQAEGEETRQNTPPDPQERFHAPLKRQGQAEGKETRQRPRQSPQNGFMHLSRGRDKQKARKQDSAPANPQERVFMRLPRGRDKQKARKQDSAPANPQERVFMRLPRGRAKQRAGGLGEPRAWLWEFG